MLRDMKGNFMKVLPVNNTSFKASICSDCGDNVHHIHPTQRVNYWPDLIDKARRSSDFEDLDELLTDLYKNNQDDVVLLEKFVKNEDTFAFSAYKTENNILIDRVYADSLFRNSINKSGFILKKVSEKGATSGVQVVSPFGKTSNFKTMVEAVKSLLTDFRNCESDVHKYLISDKYAPARDYIKRFAQKVAK
jgi:hypothetical protein